MYQKRLVLKPFGCGPNNGGWSHIKAFNFFGGVPAILVPDNLKSAVAKFDWYEPKLNETYQDMAKHYGAVIIPAHAFRVPSTASTTELVARMLEISDSGRL